MAIDPDSTPKLAPSQAEVYRVLQDADGELRRSEIVDRTDRMTARSVGRALEKLHRRGLVEYRKIDARGWFAYRAVERDQ